MLFASFLLFPRRLIIGLALSCSSLCTYCDGCSPPLQRPLWIFFYYTAGAIPVPTKSFYQLGPPWDCFQKRKIRSAKALLLDISSFSYFSWPWPEITCCQLLKPQYLLSTLVNFLKNYFCLYECFCLHAYTCFHIVQCPCRPEEGIRSQELELSMSLAAI